MLLVVVLVAALVVTLALRNMFDLAAARVWEVVQVVAWAAACPSVRSG